jgi:RNA polymerase sigma-70 factor (ECF subfamily)
VAAHIESFHRERAGDTFRGWLRTITQNKINDHFRRRGREPAGAGGSAAQARMAEVPAPPPLAEDTSDDHLEQRLLERALESIRDQFEERTWQAFWQTAIQGRLTRDVATELAMSPGAVRVAKSRVLQRLREELGDLAE